MNEPVLLDVCCGLGGAAMGYSRAGFRVIGCDVIAQPDYPFEFARMDGFAFLQEFWPLASAIHTSWPCQASSGPTKGTNAKRNSMVGKRHLDLNPAGRALLDEIGLPYVMENVQGSVLRRDLTLCGEQFGLPIIRHRYFELGGWAAPKLAHVPHRGRVSGWRHGKRYDGPYLAIYGNGGGKATTEECRKGLDIDWSWDRDQLVEAIPPAYTEHVGSQLLAHVRQAVAA